MFKTTIVTHGVANLAVPIMSAEETAITAHTTPIVAQEKSAVLVGSSVGTVGRFALLLMLPRRTLSTAPSTPIVG